jgi:Peptidase C13 family
VSGFEAVSFDKCNGHLSTIRATIRASRRTLTSGHELVHGAKSHASSVTDTSGWTPPAAETDTWALVAALSSGWDNYRHQADALRRYQILRAGGVPKDHIVLVMADDIANAPQNPEPGVVRNIPGGPNLHHDFTVDYGLSVTPAGLTDILTGNAGASTPRVLHTTASSDLYVYLVGHGGDGGIAVDAQTASEGLNAMNVLTPDLLRHALCALRGQGKVRRVLVAVESCHGGVMGDAGKSGIELGCNDSTPPGPLDGVLLLSAADPKENSFADAYDPAVGAWLGDSFSQELAGVGEGAPASSLVAVYSDVYLKVTGSHVSLYNAAHAGAIGGVPFGEFLTP